MLITPEINRENRRLAIVLAVIVSLATALLAFFKPFVFIFVLLGPFFYWLVRRRCLRRMEVMRRPFDPYWEGLLRSHVAYYNTLSETDKKRFQQLVKIFLDETRITGIQTDVDDLCLLLVAASAIIPIFGFPEWEYARLDEVLIYPGSFGTNFGSSSGSDREALGMVGTGHLSGVMILSKPDLLAGFANPADKRNVGLHEFAHLVDRADGAIDGLPPGAPAEVVRPWIEWVATELDAQPKSRSHIDDYAYTNEAEYFAVLTEYFFEAPEVLARKNPALYDMLQKMFRQDTKRFLTTASFRLPGRIRRNAKCPCGSGKKFKKCCLRNARQRASMSRG